MNYEEALQKAAKLLRLAKSSNPNEAALAASKAQDIIDRFRIEAAALTLDGQTPQQPDEPIQDFGNDPLERLNRKSSWKSRLASTIAKYNACKMYNGHYGPSVIGRPSDVATVRYIYAWLVQETDRLAARDCRGNGVSWVNNYRLGVVDTIGDRLHQQKRETQDRVRAEVALLAVGQSAEAQSLALVKINNAIARTEERREEVEAWTKEHVKLVGRASYVRYSSTARAAGQRAGREVRFTTAKGAIA